MALSDKQTAKVSEFAGTVMEADEHVVAVLGQAMKGPTVTLALISPFMTFLQTPFAIVVTERRVLLIRLRMAMTGYPPKSLEAAYPRSTVKASFKRGAMASRLVLDGMGDKPLSLSIHRIYVAGAEQVATALNKAASS